MQSINPRVLIYIYYLCWYILAEMVQSSSTACGNGLAPRSSLVLSRLSWFWQVQTQLQKSGWECGYYYYSRQETFSPVVKPLPKPLFVYAFHVHLWALHFLQAWRKRFIISAPKICRLFSDNIWLYMVVISLSLSFSFCRSIFKFTKLTFRLYTLSDFDRQYCKFTL